MDAAKLAAAIDYATANQAAAVRVYRYGCRVGVRSARRVNAHTTFQSWSMAKSITALIFGRAMTQGLVGPDDPLGSLIPVADAGPRRDHDARPADHDQRPAVERPARLQHLHAGPDPGGAHRPGGEASRAPTGSTRRAGRRCSPRRPRTPSARTSRPTRSASSSGRSGSSPAPGAGSATPPGHTQGFFGLHMVPDDFARLRRAACAAAASGTAGGCSPSASCARRSRRSPRTAATAGSSGSTRRSRASARA